MTIKISAVDADIYKRHGLVKRQDKDPVGRKGAFIW